MYHTPPKALRSLIGLSLSAVALSACDRAQTSLVPPTEPKHILVCGDGCGGGGGPVDPPKITIQITPPAPSLEINPQFDVKTADVIITNTGNTVSGATIVISTTQGAVSRHIASNIVFCPGVSTGVIPHGTCEFHPPIALSNADPGSGTLIPGPAQLRADLAAGGANFTQTGNVTLTPGLVSAPIAATWVLDGQPVLLPITIGNTGPTALTNMFLRVTVSQGFPTATSSRRIGFAPLLCNSASAPSGVLPAQSTCSMTVSTSMNNSVLGFGQIVAGDVDASIDLMQGTTVITTRHLKSSVRDIHFSGVTISDSTVAIDGAAHNFSAAINVSPEFAAPAKMVGHIRQGSAEREAVVATLSCGSGGADTLRAGTCTVAGSYSASNGAVGTGTLVPGPATLELFLRDAGSSVDTLTSTSVALTLTGTSTTPVASIGTVNVQGAAVIGAPGPSVPVAIQLLNTGVPTAGTTIRIQLQQGATARDAGNGTLSLDCGSAAGVIPTGGCTLNTHFAVSNVSSGSGTFVPGAATLGIIITDPVAGSIRKFISIPLVAQ